MTGDEAAGYLSAAQSIASLGRETYQDIRGWQQLFGGHGAGSGRMAARGAAAMAAQMARQSARLAAKQFAFAQAQQFPESPVYGPLAPVTQFDLPTKFTTKRTAIEQAMMVHPDSKKLMVKSKKLETRIGRWERQHPEAATTYAVTRKY